MNKKRILAAVLVGSTITSTLTGCSSLVGTDVAELPLVPALTEQEVIDYYAEGLKYDSVITRNNEVHNTTYVEKEVTGEKKEKLIELQGRAEDILSGMEYEYNRDNLKLVSEDTFHYIKSYLNASKLDNPQIKNVTGALGFYFVDVEYELTPRDLGKFTDLTSLMGINGAFVKDPYGVDKIDTTFLKSSVDKLNLYYQENKILNSAEFDASSGKIEVKDEDYIIASGDYDTSYYQPAYEENTEGTEEDILDETIPQASLDDLVATEETTGETTETEVEEEVTEKVDSEVASENTDVTTESETETEYTAEEPVYEEEEEDEVVTTTSTIGGMEYVSYTPDNRKCSINTSLFNSVVGSSYKSVAYMPEMELVFEKPDEAGTIGGIGIYPSGGNGLALFGYDRDEIAGTCTLRYVFKDSVDGSGEILGVNIYPKFESITTGFTTSDSNVVTPEFLYREFEKLLERADRATIDTLISSMMSGDIYEDMGFALLRGYEAQYVNLNKNMSTIRQIIARDTAKNAYLLEIESTRIEGPKDVDTYGTYRDKYYVVIQQRGSEFIITDQIRISRTLTSEPSINPDSSIIKRLVALNLAGEVNDTQKDEINKLLSDWYKAGTVRVLNATENEPKEVKHKGEKVTVTKGMYDCFNRDTTMLSTEDFEYMQSEVRALLTKKGTNVTADYSGTVTQWMGGHENQVEFTTEELINYEGKNEAVYMEVYYLVSRMHDEWVIDERTVLNENTINGGEINNIQNRLK